MSLAFPPSPTVGQSYTALSRSWEWNGEGWRLTSIGGVFGNNFHGLDHVEQYVGVFATGQVSFAFHLTNHI